MPARSGVLKAVLQQFLREMKIAFARDSTVEQLNQVIATIDKQAVNQLAAETIAAKYGVEVRRHCPCL